VNEFRDSRVSRGACGGGTGRDRGSLGAVLPERTGRRARRAGVGVFCGSLQAAGRSAATQRSYALALLRWFRFTWAVGVPWEQATRSEARDFCRRLQLADKPGHRRAPAAPVPGKRPASAKYAPSTVAHCETVCRGFYSYHLESGTGPIVNPFPLARTGRAGAHRNPAAPFPQQRAGLFRPRLPRRVPRQIHRQRVQRAVRAASLAPRPGPWWRSGSRPGPVPRSFSAPSARALTRGSSWSR